MSTCPPSRDAPRRRSPPFSRPRSRRFAAQAAGPTLLNVSYDVAREFYKEINPAFAAHWKQQTGEDVTRQPVARRLEQAGALGDRRPRGRRRDDEPVERHRRHRRARQADPGGLGQAAAQQRAPTTSVTVILVRKGNPKGIRDWTDLAKPGVSVVIPNPKITGNGRYTYVAAWGSAIKAGGTPAQAQRAGAEDLRQRAGVRRRRPRRDDDLRAAQHRRRAVHLRERGQPDQGRVRRQLRGRLSDVDASWPRTRSR